MSLKQAKTLMTQDEFWNIIAKSNKGENLHEVLSKFSDDKIFGYCYWWDYFYTISYKQDLWAVAYVVMGDCDDDNFDDFRYWLIFQGREVFESAMKDVDSLCEVFEKMGDNDYPARSEEMTDTPQEIIDERHGDDAFYEMEELYSDLYLDYPKINFDWNKDDENSIRQICPKTFDKWWGNDRF
ncbi:DUF4240 domain-containing protein [Moraxella oblonga]|uniref:DUF4240 domain-containing protein n=1 Tax=Moraxella oblonga TaxID=200413 RepID=UPI00082A613D|nr:DUF4240 domain-containing protein [Moraxella oblonga]